jgi:ornithine cyclodeaminase
MPTTDGDQLTVVFDDQTGRVQGIIRGPLLGAARTGAIGAVAVDVLASPDAGSMGLIGTGRQAFSQLWAIRAVRELRDVRVFGRDAARRDAFAGRARAELGLGVTGVADPRDAVADADIVVLATSSRTPVIESGWVRPGAHVTTLGPKDASAHECPADLAERAGIILTDSLAQVDGYPRPFFLQGALRQRMGSLGEWVAGAGKAASTGRERERTDQVTLFCSVGLAGTEVAVAAALLRGAPGEPAGQIVPNSRSPASPRPGTI